jgi:hypothetical protein
MNTAWIAVAGTLGGVVVTIVADAWRTRQAFRREKAWALFEAERRHLEQVYEALEQLREEYTGRYVEVRHYLTTCQPKSSGAEQSRVPWAHLRMLVHLYVPGVSDHLQSVERESLNLTGAIDEAVDGAGGGLFSNKGPLRDALDESYNRFFAAASTMRDTIVQRSRDLGAQAERLATEGGGRVVGRVG